MQEEGLSSDDLVHRNFTHLLSDKSSVTGYALSSRNFGPRLPYKTEFLVLPSVCGSLV